MIQFRFLPTLPSLLVAPQVPLIHRDLSWLQFNDRVLAESRNAQNPLLERVKFLAISASNLDEFFMIRVSSLNKTIRQALKSNPEKAEQGALIRASILENVAKFCGKQMETLDLLVPELESFGISLLRQLRPDDLFFSVSQVIFETRVLPYLSEPESYRSTRVHELENLQMVVTDGRKWIPVPKSLPPVFSHVSEDGSSQFFYLDDLLLTHLPKTSRAGFEGLQSLTVLRLTRDGDFSVELDDADTESIPDAVKRGIRRREKGRPIRLQYVGEFQENILSGLTRQLRLRSNHVISAPYTLCLHGLWSVFHQAQKSEVVQQPLAYPPLRSLLPKPFRDSARIFERIAKEDILLHHPYDSFDALVEFIRTAAKDPQVIEMALTVYRTDRASPIIEAIKAVARKKKVRVLIELRARFDELNNLRLAEELRLAGAEVGFGFGRLKLHAKMSVVTRMEDGVPRTYTHLSTGNYHSGTSRTYTDLAILTAHPEMGRDALHFFARVFKEQVPSQFRRLVSAPLRLHRKLIALIEAETQAAIRGEKARIVAKVNALVDEEVIFKLYEASQAGVTVDLIVRGACSLIPGVKGLSDHIRVISVIDRFLEHSRIYYFAHSRAMYLSSADWMPRNFFSRLELAFPILDPLIYRYLEEVLIPTYLKDTVRAKELTAVGTWKKRTPSRLTSKAKRELVRSQFVFEELAAKEYAGTPLE